MCKELIALALPSLSLSLLLALILAAFVYALACTLYVTAVVVPGLSVYGIHTEETPTALASAPIPPVHRVLLDAVSPIPMAVLFRTNLKNAGAVASLDNEIAGININLESTVCGVIVMDKLVISVHVVVPIDCVAVNTAEVP